MLMKPWSAAGGLVAGSSVIGAGVSLGWPRVMRAVAGGLAVAGMGSERRGGEPPSQFLAQDDGPQIERHDQADEEEGGGEDHRLGGIGIGGLEAEIVDVEAEMHELLVEM